MISNLRLFLLLLTVSLPDRSPAQEIVRTAQGTVQGYTREHIRIFKGIPFAAPPVGPLRWKAPQPVQAWEGIKKCKAFSASPVQGKPNPFMFWSKEFLIPDTPISEDCLYLNVWTGVVSSQAKKPVLVYIYGGGFRSGGAGCPIYDGYAMADKGIVFVSINYRVGVFGFLAHSELTAESEYHASGNYALLDMIAALQWVKKNILSFGGDPNNVTIAGQSAGAFGVNYLTASPLARGLFHRAIAESGGSFYTSPARPVLDLKGAELMGIKFAGTLGCKDINELRAKSADEILSVQGGLSGPIIDGYVIPSGIFEIYSKGKQNDIPILVGWNENDKLFWKPKELAVFKEEMQKRFGNKTNDFLKAYPSNTQAESDQSQNDMSRDETFAIQDYTWAKMQTQTRKAKAYIYNFNRKLPSYNEETQFGAFHSGEIVYAYDNLKTVDRPWEPIDQKIAAQMSSYWVNFAKTGNPNGPGLPKWPAYNPTSEPVLIIDKVIESKSLPTKMQMSFLEEYFKK